MRRALVIFVFVALAGSAALAQFTTVTGTITDPNSVPYSNGNITAQLVTTGTTPTLNGLPFSMSGSSGLDVNGKFTMRLADNTQIVPGGLQWKFTVTCGGGCVPPAGGTGPQQFSVSITISGVSQDISATLSAAAPALTRVSGGGANPPFNTVTAGANPNALTIAAGGSLSPGAGSVLGTIRANQEAWTIGPPNASFYEAMSTTGGSISVNQTVLTQITYVTSVGGETLPSILPSASNTLPTNCSSGSTCSYFLSGYPLPPGYSGYTVYTCATSSSCTPLKFTGCINITGSCTITGSGTGAGVPTSNTAYLAQPTPIGTNTCPPSASPWLYVNDGFNWYNYIAVDASNTGANPPAPYNKLVFCRPIWVNDTGVDPPLGRNAVLNIFHLANGSIINAGNQDRNQFNFWTNCATDNPCGDTGNHYGGEALQAEADWFDTTGTVFGHPDSEVAGGSFQAADFHTTVGETGPSLGITGVRAHVFREAAATSFSNACTYCWQGIYANAQNNSTASGNGQYLAAVNATCAEASGSPSNINCMGVHITGHGSAWTHSYGIYIEDGGTGATQNNMNSHAAASNGGKNYFEGSTFLNHVSTTGPNQGVTNPTSCTLSAGFGTTATCTFDTGSNDSSGTMTITPSGTGIVAVGNVTLNYQATLGTNSTSCLFFLVNGTATFNARATAIGNAAGTTAAFTGIIDNNAANFTSGSTYKVNYWCPGK